LARALDALRVLIVEDEALVALMIEDLVSDFGCEIAGSFARVSDALAVAESLACDVAILDVNVAGEEVYPLAERLRRRGIPIVFSTGYGGTGLRRDFQGAPVIAKPFDEVRLRRALEVAFGG
jgi:CheY-like chemotaxis protein